MSTGIKNEFQAISSQKYHFRLKQIPPGQFGSNHVDRCKNEFQVVEGQNRHFRSKSGLLGQYKSNHVDREKKKRVSGYFRSKPLFSFKTGSIELY